MSLAVIILAIVLMWVWVAGALLTASLFIAEMEPTPRRERLLTVLFWPLAVTLATLSDVLS